MKNRMRILSFALLLVIGLLASGCSNAEVSLYQAFSNMQNVQSMESTSDLTFNVTASNLPKDEERTLSFILPMLQNVKLHADQKMVQNPEQTAGKVQNDLNVQVSGMNFKMNTWVDSDFSGETPRLKEIIKFPKSLMNMVGFPVDQEYMVYDFNDPSNELFKTLTSMNVGESTKMAKTLQPIVDSFMKNYLKSYHPDFTIATSQKQKNGDMVYEVKLTDATFKKIVRSFVNDLLQNKDAQKLVEQILAADPQTAPLAQDFALGAQKHLPKVLKQINTFLDAYEDVQLLGDKGLTLYYTVNKQGYIVGTKGTLDLVIDRAGLQRATSNLAGIPYKDMGIEEQGFFNITVDFNSTNKKINQDVSIQFPDLTEINSVNYSDLVK